MRKARMISFFPEDTIDFDEFCKWAEETWIPYATGTNNETLIFEVAFKKVSLAHFGRSSYAFRCNYRVSNGDTILYEGDAIEMAIATFNGNNKETPCSN